MTAYDLLKFDWDAKPSTSSHYGTHEYIWYNREAVDESEARQLVLHTIIRSGIAGYARGDFHADVMLMQYQVTRVEGVADPDTAVLSVASSDNPADHETLDMLFGGSWRKFIATIESSARSEYVDNPPTQVMSVVGDTEGVGASDDKEASVSTSQDDSVADGAGMARSGQQLTDMIVAAAAAAEASESTLSPEVENDLDLLFGSASAEDHNDGDEEDKFDPEDLDGLLDPEDEYDEPRGYDNDFDDEFLDSGIDDDEDDDDETTDDDDDDDDDDDETDDDGDTDTPSASPVSAQPDAVLASLRETYGDAFVEDLIARAVKESAE